MTSFEMIIQQSINGLMLSMMYSLVAVGFTLYFGVLNVINFGHGDFFMLGGFMALIMTALAGVFGWTENIFGMLIFIFVGSMVLTSIIGIVTARLAIKPVSKAPMLISLLVTLGLALPFAKLRVFFIRADPTRSSSRPFYRRVISILATFSSAMKT